MIAQRASDCGFRQRAACLLLAEYVVNNFAEYIIYN